jgi:hypothetical protein
MSRFISNDAVCAIHQQDGGFMPADIDFGQPPECRDNQEIANLRSPSGGVIHQNLTTTARTCDCVDFKALAVGYVPYMNALKWRDTGSRQ